MNTNGLGSSWLTRYGVAQQARLRLFCFPYAGGAAQIFRHWHLHLSAFVEVAAVQLPGRGSHIREKPFLNLSDLVSAAASALAPYMNCPFAFFGHSMGALIAFELARYQRREGRREPVHLFLSGCRAPQLPSRSADTYDLPEAEFLDELRRLNGTPAEVIDHPELIQLMLPMLRADFAVAQTYKYAPELPLPTPMTVFSGSEDGEIEPESVTAWREQTTATFSLHTLPGDHFFIHFSESLLLQIVARELNRIADTLL
jgi:medium-chain acyl-[acyl-carrier-protein] hydrolase